MSDIDPKNDVMDSYNSIKNAMMAEMERQGLILSKDIRMFLIWMIEYTKDMQSQYFGISKEEIEKFDRDVQVQFKSQWKNHGPLVIKQPETEHIWGG